jgi:hypothetical protein
LSHLVDEAAAKVEKKNIPVTISKLCSVSKVGANKNTELN